PCDEGDPYYPVPRPENAEIYKQYKALADETPEVHFVGRLATYKYYNMDQVVAQALTPFSRIMGTKRPRRPVGVVETAAAPAAAAWSEGARGSNGGKGSLPMAAAPARTEE
ncbi:MAG TPA: UDP-galactopyranose mutase, partial [Longimicrobiaceae bacterium]|nr:UDP-galactopyranose mutase [Longimicrobiaceae bacterium]